MSACLLEKSFLSVIMLKKTVKHYWYTLFEYSLILEKLPGNVKKPLRLVLMVIQIWDHNTVKLQWLKHFWDHENMFETGSAR